jgi:hypothetical protein
VTIAELATDKKLKAFARRYAEKDLYYRNSKGQIAKLRP